MSQLCYFQFLKIAKLINDREGMLDCRLVGFPQLVDGLRDEPKRMDHFFHWPDPQSYTSKRRLHTYMKLGNCGRADLPKYLTKFNNIFVLRRLFSHKFWLEIASGSIALSPELTLGRDFVMHLFSNACSSKSFIKGAFIVRRPCIPFPYSNKFPNWGTWSFTYLPKIINGISIHSFTIL